MNHESDVYQRLPDVRFRVIDREGVVIRQTAGEALVLNEVGARFLQLVDGTLTLGEIVDRLLEEFKVERDQLRADIDGFVAELSENGIIEASSSPSPVP